MVLLHSLMMAYLAVNPSTQFQRGPQGMSASWQSHDHTVGLDHYWQMVQKLCAKIKKNGRDKLIGGNTMPLDSAVREWLTNVRGRLDAV